jgi:hypothetical protein
MGDLNINFFLIHGSAMWLAWGVFSLVQISSNRYMKGSHWDSRMWIHRLSAGIIIVITLVYALYAFGFLGWKVLDNAHSYFVFPILALVLIVAILGVATRSMLRRKKWSTKSALVVKRVHWFFAYLIIVLGIGAIITGIYFYRTNPKHESDIPLEWIHLTLFVMALVILEVLYRQSLSPQTKFEMGPHKVTIPLKEFKSRVKNGE